MPVIPSRPRRSVFAVGAVFTLVALTACSSGGSPTAAASSATSAPGTAASGPGSSGPSSTAATVTIKDFKFSPDALTVAPGTVITVTNQDSTAHTLTATGAKAFDTGSIAPGKSATITAPSTAGSYPYICTIHQFMTGTLTVS